MEDSILNTCQKGYKDKITNNYKELERENERKRKARLIKVEKEQLEKRERGG